MRSLLQFLAFFAAVSVCLCYESHESTESIEDLHVSRNQANSFITPQRGNVYSPPRGNGLNHHLMRKVKTVAERRAETCEDYNPCRFYAYHHGFKQAYERYFGARNTPQRPAAVRRY